MYRSETCCTRLAENSGRKKSPKSRHLGTIAQLCLAISLQLRHISTIGKRLFTQQYLPHMFSQYGEIRPTNNWDRFGAPGLISTHFGGSCPLTEFASCSIHFASNSILRSPKLAALLHGTPALASAKVCGVVQGMELRNFRRRRHATYIRQGGHHVGHRPTF